MRDRPSALRRVVVTFVCAAERFWRHGDLFSGAAISFYALLSLLPLTVLLLVSLRLIAPAPLVARHIAVVFGGRTGADLIPRIVGEAYEQERSLEWWGLLTLVVAATGVFAAVQTAFDRVWECRGRIMPIRLLFGAFMMAASLLIFLGMLVGTMLVFRLTHGGALSRLPGGSAAPGTGMRSAINIATALAQFGIFWTAYRLLPSVSVRWDETWPGAVVATVVW